MWTLILTGGILFTPISEAPGPQIVNCSKVEYRQAHLAECNQNGSTAPVGGGPRRRGLLGLGGLGGIL